MSGIAVLGPSTLKNSFEQRRKIVIFAIISCLFIVMTYLTSSVLTARAANVPDTVKKAAEAESDEDSFKTTYEANKNTIINFIANPLMSRLDKVFFSDTVINSKNIFDGTADTTTALYTEEDVEEAKKWKELLAPYSAGENSVFGLGRMAAKITSAIALLYAIVLCFVAMFNEMQRGDVTIDTWIRVLLRFVIAMVLVLNYVAIWNAARLVGMFITERIRDLMPKSESVGGLTTWLNEKLVITANYKEPSGGILNKIWTVISKNIPFYFAALKGYALMVVLLVAFGATAIGMMVLVYSMAIEIAVRLALLPLALADIAGHGARSAGMGFIKKVVALFMRIGLCYIIAAVSNLLASAILSTPMQGKPLMHIVVTIMSVLALYTTTLTLCKQTGQIASQALGN